MSSLYTRKVIIHCCLLRHAKNLTVVESCAYTRLESLDMTLELYICGVRGKNSFELVTVGSSTVQDKEILIHLWLRTKMLNLLELSQSVAIFSFLF